MKYLLLTATFILYSMNTIAQTYYGEEGTAIFYSKVPLHNFSGTSKNLTGQIDLSTGVIDFYIDLSTLDTGNGKRDKDMRKTLKVDKYPFGEFYGKLSSEFNPDLQEEQPVTVAGTFKMHGKEKAIEVNGTMLITDNALNVKANWILNLDDYQIKPPKFLVLKVDEEQEIEIDITLKPQS